MTTQLTVPAADSPPMTLPRPVVRGATHMVTRRIERRRLLLTPTPLVNQIVGYCVARAAEKYGIDIHVLQVLANHYHLLLTDPDGALPDFMAWVDREIAKAINHVHGRSENLWSSDHYSQVRLHDAETVFGKCQYVFVNCVKAGLVQNYIEWPGLRSTPGHWTRPPMVFKRPAAHFSKRDKRWEQVELRFTVPPQFRDRPAHEFARDMDAALRLEQNAIRQERKRNGQGFLGVKRIQRTDPFSTPSAPHVKGKLSPTFAAATEEGQQIARAERRHFLTAYREALEAWRTGLECLFPYGTFWLCRFAGVPCAGPDTIYPIADTG